MATSRTISYPRLERRPGVVEVDWPSLTKNEVGDAADIWRWGDRHVAVTGTFDTVTATIQGSMDGTNWFTVEDAGGIAVTFTVAGMSTIRNNCKFIRPSIGGGGVGTTNLRVLLTGIIRETI